MSTSLRTRIIRLAHQNPELRPHLLPLLREAGRRIKTIGYLTGDGMAFLKKVLARYPGVSVGTSPGSEVLRNRGRFNIDTFQYSDSITMDFGMPARYEQEDAYIIPDLKRRGKIPNSVQTVDELNEIQAQKEKAIRHEALVEAPTWFKANGATDVRTEESNTALGGPTIFLTAYFPKEWVR